MFCPECKAEYVEGVTVCADCGVPLVDVLPPESDHAGVEYVRILSTYNAGDVAVIRSILEGTDIAHYFEGEIFNEVTPLIQPVKLFIARHQVSAAKELLKDLDMHFLGLSANED